jgi:hypothetical protein
MMPQTNCILRLGVGCGWSSVRTTAQAARRRLAAWIGGGSDYYWGMILCPISATEAADIDHPNHIYSLVGSERN